MHLLLVYQVLDIARPNCHEVMMGQVEPGRNLRPQRVMNESEWSVVTCHRMVREADELDRACQPHISAHGEGPDPAPSNTPRVC